MNLNSTGRLSETSVYRVFQSITVKKFTGILTVQSETDTVMFTFEQGLCVHAESQYPRDDLRLGRFLLIRGLITENQLNTLLEEHTRKYIKLGSLAREKGHVDLNQLMDTLEDQILLIVFQCMTWKTGSYFMKPKESVHYDRDTTRPIDLGEVVEKGPDIARQWPEIIRRIPDQSAVPRLIPEIFVVPESVEIDSAGKGHPIVLTPQQEIVYNHINGVFPVQAVIQACHQFAWDSYKAVVDLEDLGVLEIPTPETGYSTFRGKMREIQDTISLNVKFILIPVIVLILLVVLRFMPGELLPLSTPGDKTLTAVVQTKVKMQNVHLALQVFKLIHGKHPQFLTELIDARMLSENDVIDAWGKKLYFHSSRNEIEIVSQGRDGSWATRDDLRLNGSRIAENDVCFFPGSIDIGSEEPDGM
ncbi:DUF4388 domain-containing protein [bacterium]|nr:DUF4388 domain-containing protein [candidate division CSSED10-310 bacterium]